MTSPAVEKFDAHHQLACRRSRRLRRQGRCQEEPVPEARDRERSSRDPAREVLREHYNEASTDVFQGINQILTGPTPASQVLPQIKQKPQLLLK